MVRQLDKVTPRVETGITRFGDDWAGVFIRGDNAMGYALYLQGAQCSDPIAQAAIDGLIKLLSSVIREDKP